MDTQAKTVVLLKYEILTRDQSTWKLCETYPIEVRSKWAWRCAVDVEHLVEGNQSAENLVRVAKEYHAGLATKEELDIARDSCVSSLDSPRSYWRAHSTYYASLVDQVGNYTSAIHTTNAVFYATYGIGVYGLDRQDKKWKLYISWLIEELCEYESKQ